MKFFESEYGHLGSRRVQNCVVVLVGCHQVASKKCSHIKSCFSREGNCDKAPLSERYNMVNCASGCLMKGFVGNCGSTKF
jgi:hypothetical protein